MKGLTTTKVALVVDIRFSYDLEDPRPVGGDKTREINTQV